jgi:hypothetical protein
MSGTPDVIQMALFAGAAAMTLVAAVRVVRLERRRAKRPAFRIQIGRQVQTIDPATMSSAEIDGLLDRLKIAIEAQVRPTPKRTAAPPPRVRHRSAWPEQSIVLRLPTFDKSVLRLAATGPRASQETLDGDTRYVLRDAGQDRLEILMEATGEVAGASVLPVTVDTGERVVDYVLLFMTEQSGLSVASVRVPGFRNVADVTVHERHDVAWLGGIDVEIVARSVRATPGAWAPAWHAVAGELAEGDPVRAAIEDALRS